MMVVEIVAVAAIVAFGAAVVVVVVAVETGTEMAALGTVEVLAAVETAGIAEIAEIVDSKILKHKSREKNYIEKMSVLKWFTQKSHTICKSEMCRTKKQVSVLEQLLCFLASTAVKMYCVNKA